MKTKIIFKTVALAMLMPAMLLTTACSNDDDVANTSNITSKGYALPVTVNVSREDGATRATYNESTRKLEFSTGDKLFVEGIDNGEVGRFAGELTWQSGGTFSGTIYTQNPYTGTADALFTDAYASGIVKATLLPNGYESYNFLSIYNNSSDDLYDDVVAYSMLTAFVASETAKATGVEQLSWEKATTYSSGFALAPANAILNFTISGLEAGAQDVTLSIDYGGTEYTVTGSVTPNASGVATFAIGVPVGANIKDKDNNLTVGTHNFTLPSSTTFAAGKIYNITRPAPVVTDLSTISVAYTASDGETLTGTLGNNVKISIAAGATVTLDGVSINATGAWTSGEYAGITCEGDATIILNGTNAVTGFDGFYPGIYVPVGSTVRIKGSGSLTASSNGGGAGIGGGWDIDCGNIEIQGGTITATAGNEAAGIGGGRDANCGNITISGGTITATGGYGAAGIGSGTCSEASCGSITISGGTVTATGGKWAPGIGSGAFGSSCGAINITSGVTHVTATKGEDSPNSIGAGDLGSSCGTKSIEDPSKVTEN